MTKKELMDLKHNINNPLSIIIGMVFLLESEGADIKKITKINASINRVVKYLNSIKDEDVTN